MLPAVVGHAAALATLPDPVPHAVLVTGPEGVGKRLIAKHIASRTGVRGIDYQNLGKLNRDRARGMIEFHSTYPVDGEVKCSVADLTYSSPEAMNSILKLLEEPPPYSRIILHTDRPTLLTIGSRCFQVRCGLLTEEETVEVLRRLGAEHAQEAARAARGRVSVALEYSIHYNVRLALEALLGTLEKRDGKALEDALHHALSAPLRVDAETQVERVEVLKKMLRRAIVTRQGILAEVEVTKWREALEIVDRPGRAPLLIRSAVWTLVTGL